MMIRLEIRPVERKNGLRQLPQAGEMVLERGIYFTFFAGDAGAVQ